MWNINHEQQKKTYRAFCPICGTEIPDGKIDKALHWFGWCKNCNRRVYVQDTAEETLDKKGVQ